MLDRRADRRLGEIMANYKDLLPIFDIAHVLPEEPYHVPLQSPPHAAAGTRATHSDHRVHRGCMRPVIDLVAGKLGQRRAVSVLRRRIPAKCRIANAGSGPRHAVYLKDYTLRIAES
jgi:hypothetical protein